MQCRVMSAIGGSTDFAEQVYLLSSFVYLYINNVHVLKLFILQHRTRTTR